MIIAKSFTLKSTDSIDWGHDANKNHVYLTQTVDQSPGISRTGNNKKRQVHILSEYGVSESF